MAEKYRAIQQMKETKQALAAVSGINDDLVLEKLIALDLRPETLASISLVPLIEIAWADGDVDQKEKDAILSAVSKFGWTADSLNYELLDQWLKNKPSESLLTAWKHYVDAVCHKMTNEEVAHFKKEIMAHVTVVAEAAGGFLGIGKISAEEQNMITQLESAFRNK
jgi:tellurite resistance protein